jgi:hypothetical protein
VDAALFALHSPLSKGVIPADEVGLSKIIEASLVVSGSPLNESRRSTGFQPPDQHNTIARPSYARRVSRSAQFSAGNQAQEERLRFSATV